MSRVGCKNVEAYDIACLVSECTPWMYNDVHCKVSLQETLRYCTLTFPRFYVDLTIHYLLPI